VKGFEALAKYNGTRMQKCEGEIFGFKFGIGDLSTSGMGHIDYSIHGPVIKRWYTIYRVP